MSDMSDEPTPAASESTEAAATVESSPADEISSATAKTPKRGVPTWAWIVIVALVAALIAGPGSIALYIARTHHVEQSQRALGEWWSPVSAQLEKCAVAVSAIKLSVAQGTGHDVVAAGNNLNTCLNDVPTNPAPDGTVALALSGALDSLHAVAAQTIRLGQVMGSSTYDQSNPDHLNAYVALTKQFVVAGITTESLQSVVRQAAGQTTSPLPAPTQ